MTKFDVPESAITTFERIHNLNVTVHDLSGTLAPFLKPERFHHRSPLCLAVKAQGHETACLRFEIESLQHNLAHLAEGRIHICHAGLVEWMVPVFEQKKPSWVLFAGPRRPGGQLASAVHSRPTRWLKPPWNKRPELPSFIEEDEAQLIMEHLRQLAARLQKWAEESTFPRSSGDKTSAIMCDQMMSRESVVRQFIEDQYGQPVTLLMLAKKLSLSEGRASHLVREKFGTTFRELLIRKRLDIALELLRHSGMSVLEVALASGFKDVAHFHRLFRHRIGTTPARHRSGTKS